MRGLVFRAIYSQNENRTLPGGREDGVDPDHQNHPEIRGYGRSHKIGGRVAVTPQQNESIGLVKNSKIHPDRPDEKHS